MTSDRHAQWFQSIAEGEHKPLHDWLAVSHDQSGNGGFVSTLQLSKKYVALDFAIRNNGSPDYWQVISSAGHDPLNPPDAITTTSQLIKLTWSSITFTGVGSFLVVPDEIMAESSYTAGSSVGLTEIDIYLQRIQLCDFVSYNGTTWTSQNSVFTFSSFTAGVLTLTHAPLVGAAGSATGRGGVYVPQFGSNGTTSTQISFYDWAGTLQTTADTNMKVFIVRTGVPGSSIDPTVQPPTSHNLWCHGIMEISA